MNARGRAFSQLRAMLTYCRPAGSKTEHAFCEHYLRPLGAHPDSNRNWIAYVDGPGSDRVLWSAHTDTVHRLDGMQTVERTGPYLHLPRMTRSSCLGADDTVGVWLLCSMIARRVPGRYVFHAAEEQGCVGSRALLTKPPAWIDGVEIAIAVDRKGTTDVITHMGHRVCSDRFAHELSDAIGMHYAPCNTGVLTDTLEYSDMVSECTNLSIGYERAHSDNEYCDVEHAIALRNRLCAIDMRTINAYRDPFEYVQREDEREDDRAYGQRVHWRHYDRDTGRYLDPAYDEVAEFFRNMRAAQAREDES